MVPIMSKKAGFIFVLVIMIWSSYLSAFLSSNARNDPWHAYGTPDPHTFLYRRELERLRGNEDVSDAPQYVGFSLSPFGQSACRSKGLVNSSNPCCETLCSSDGSGITCSPEATNTCCCDPLCLELGDIEGKWSLVAMLFGAKPQGVTSLASVSKTLDIAFKEIFPGQPWGEGVVDDPKYLRFGKCCSTDKSYCNCSQDMLGLCCGSTDCAEADFAYVSFPIKYRKRGLRAELAVRVTNGFGLMLQTGFADICQRVGCKIGCEPCTTSSTSCCCEVEQTFVDGVKKYLICKYPDIVHDLCLNAGTWHNVSLEDLRLLGYWRHAYPVNKDCHLYCCPPFFAIPFVVFGGSIAAGKEKDPCWLFSLPFGNNGHHSIGATAGMDLDFIETVVIGGEAGITHFFSHEFCNLRMPNSEYQTHVFPFTTAAVVYPGLNWHFGLKLACYHFLDCLSFYFQYIHVQHRSDRICVKSADTAFKPWVLERRSCWEADIANIGFNYDISPDISTGVLWQAPLSQRLAYRTSTLMFSFNAAF